MPSDIRHPGPPLPLRRLTIRPDDILVAVDGRAAEFSFAALAAALAALRWRLLALLLLCLGGAAALVVLLPPRYQADAVLLYNDVAEKPALPDQGFPLLDLSLLTGQLNTGIQQVVARAEGRRMVMQTVEEAGLLPLVFADLWTGAGWDLPWGWEAPPTAYDAFRRLRREVDWEIDPAARLVTVTATARTREGPARLVRALVSTVNSQLRAEVLDEIDRQLALAEAQLADTTAVEVRKALIELVATLKKRQVTVKSSIEFPFRMVDPPLDPRRPHWPDPLLLLPAGLVLWLALSLLWALSRPVPARHDDGC